ncbi:nuclease [Protaetiibacter intestinalis]|uniref:Nuclease n=2 Tax=Protaetiibacter intestinalis TaxID=2419774 RepID=A0A387BB61_9MICO|nr:nuclease [Protaetiibacter intestinalis]
MCGEACSGAGHRVHPIQATVAASAPGKWVDALASADEHVLDLVTLDGTAVRLWHHLPLHLDAGEPVAYHPVAGVVAVRGAALNVRVLTA